MSAGTSAGCEDQRAQFRVANADAAARLALAALVDDAIHLRPGAGQHVKQRRPRGIQAQILDRDVRSGEGRRRHGPEGGRRHVAGDLGVHGVQRPAAVHVDGGSRRFDVPAKRRDRQFRMISCRRRFVDGGSSLEVQARQQHRALDLGAGHRRRVLDRMEPAAGDRERRAAVDGLDAGAHAGERIDDPLHRPPAQRGIAGDRRGEGMGRENARQQPCRRARVLRVERRRGRRQPTQASAVHDDGGLAAGDRIGLALEGHAERAQAVERGRAIGAGRIVRDPARAIGQRRQQRVAMRDGLVAGDAKTARQAPRRDNMRFQCRRHPATIPCGSPRPARARDRRREAAPRRRNWLDHREGLCYPLQSLDRADAPGARRMSSPQPDIVRLEFCSAFDMLDFVQVVGDHLCRRVGFDEDSMHWVERRDSRVRHQRDQAREPERPAQAGSRRVHLLVGSGDRRAHRRRAG